MTEKQTPMDRMERIQKRHAAAEQKLRRAKEAARKARLDDDLALLALIREQTIDSLGWDDWEEIMESPVPTGASTVLDVLAITSERILHDRQSDGDRVPSADGFDNGLS